jgi:hypothetical protein
MVVDIDPEAVASDLAESGLMDEETALVYVHRVLLHHSPQQTAGFLGLSISAVDERLEEARTDVSSLIDVFAALRDHEAIPVRRSPENVWHRIDTAGCENAPEERPVAPHEERLAFEADLDAFDGTLCVDCFPGR